MTALIVSIIALVLALYIGFKRKVVDKKSKYYFLPDAMEHHSFIKSLCRSANIRGVYIVTETTTSILGKKRKETYLEFTFYKNINSRKFYLP